MKKAASILCLLPLLAGCGFEERIPLKMTLMNQTQPLRKETNLESIIRFDIGSLEITREENANSLYSLDMEYDKASCTPIIHYDSISEGKEGRFSFSLESMEKTTLRRERYNNRLRLALTNSIPLSLRITTKVGDVHLSLSGMKLARIDFESGVGGTKISSYKSNPIPCEYVRLKNGVGSIEAIGLGNINFRELDFNGGVGGANLDFTGEWKQNAIIRIKVGVGGVNLRMPREIGVRIDAEKNLLSGLQLEGFTQQGAVYYSDNYDKAAFKASIQVATGVGGFKITWI
jgi:hypothetical protein